MKIPEFEDLTPEQLKRFKAVIPALPDGWARKLELWRMSAPCVDVADHEAEIWYNAFKEAVTGDE